MTFHYDRNLGTQKDEVRFRLGDTDSADYEFEDEEITAMLVLHPAPILCAARCARSRAAKYARIVSVSADGTRVSMQQLYQHYTDLAKQLESDHIKSATSIGMLEPGGMGEPVIDGISIAEMDTVRQDSDRVPPLFRRGMHDNPDPDDAAKRDPFIT